MSIRGLGPDGLIYMETKWWGKVKTKKSRKPVPLKWTYSLPQPPRTAVTVELEDWY